MGRCNQYYPLNWLPWPQHLLPTPASQGRSPGVRGPFIVLNKLWTNATSLKIYCWLQENGNLLLDASKKRCGFLIWGIFGHDQAKTTFLHSIIIVFLTDIRPVLLQVVKGQPWIPSARWAQKTTFSKTDEASSAPHLILEPQQRIQGPPCPQDFFKIMQFSGNCKEKPPILNNFRALGHPLWVKTPLAPWPKSWIRAWAVPASC